MLKSIRRSYWVTQEFIKRHHHLITRTILAVIGLSLLLAAFIKYLPAPRSHTRIGLVGKYTPETLPLIIREQVSIGLVKLDDNGQPQQALASSWQVSEDGTDYSFTLDDSYHWHGDGKVKPADLNYNFQDVEVTTTDHTIEFHLQDPFAPFFSAVSRPILKDGKLGVGEYTIAKTSIYSGILQSTTLVSDTKKLTYKFYPTEASAVTAFKLGEIDRLEGLTYIPTDLASDPAVNITQNNDTQKIAVIFFNNNDSLLTSKPLRQALAYSIPDKSFGNERATSPIPKDSWAHNSLVKDYEYDPEHARSLLKDELPDLSAVEIELKTMLQYLDIAESVAESWRETLGIKVNVKVVTTLSSDYQALLADFAPPLDPDQYTIWHSTQPSNFTHFANLKVDKLLEDGRRTLDLKLRKEIYQDFQRFLLEDSPAIFLFESNTHDLTHNSLL